MTAEQTLSRLARVNEVVMLRGEKSRTSLYQALKKGTFTQPIKLSGKSVAWLLEEVQVLVRARGLGADDAQLAELVNRLHAERGVKLAALMAKGV